MTEWFYRATPTKVSYEETRNLAIVEGFICRSAYEDNETRADNTQHVDFGHIIHIYFTEAGERKVIGTFEVVGPRRHAFGNRFRKIVPGTVLYEVDDQFAQTLLQLGEAGAEKYRLDPVLKKVTGWALVQRPDINTPPYPELLFQGRTTLVRRPNP